VVRCRLTEVFWQAGESLNLPTGTQKIERSILATAVFKARRPVRPGVGRRNFGDVSKLENDPVGARQ
jgi:hypothetical protein